MNRLRDSLRCGFGLVPSLLLACVAAENPSAGGEAHFLHPDGSTHAALVSVDFPLIRETSSLTWDSATGAFYTTPDKGEPNLVVFALDSDSIRILRQDTIPDLPHWPDLEGIEFVPDERLGRVLQISTENVWSNGQLTAFCIDPVTCTVLSSGALLASPPVAGGRNTFMEGFTYHPGRDAWVVSWEREPVGLLFVDRTDTTRRATVDEKTLSSRYSALVDAQYGDQLSPPELFRLHQVSLAGLAYDPVLDRVLLLNRLGRSIVTLRLDSVAASGWKLDEIYPYYGVDIDDPAVGPDSDLPWYGLAEGLAVARVHGQDSWVIITDPGSGNRPRLVAYPAPGR